MIMTRVHGSRPSRSQATNIEGPIARWYARQRGSAPQLAEVRSAATRLTEVLPAHADILEVAPGPGYLAVELARRGFHVAALDISQSFVAMVAHRARDAGVQVDVRQGDAALLPFDTGSFDMIICQAAFKNFGQPARVLDEMHRVLRPGGIAVIEDMNSETTTADIDREVRNMGLGPLASVMTKVPLMGLRRRAYSPTEFRRLADGSPFDTCYITTEGIGMEVRLTR
jgi:ubiquinone/menaquinone biosynthesis C-methylase UbiE